jgi:hypothetical protein
MMAITTSNSTNVNALVRDDQRERLPIEFLQLPRSMTTPPCKRVSVRLLL